MRRQQQRGSAAERRNRVERAVAHLRADAESLVSRLEHDAGAVWRPIRAALRRRDGGVGERDRATAVDLAHVEPPSPGHAGNVGQRLAVRGDGGIELDPRIARDVFERTNGGQGVRAGFPQQPADRNGDQDGRQYSCPGTEHHASAPESRRRSCITSRARHRIEGHEQIVHPLPAILRSFGQALHDERRKRRWNVRPAIHQRLGYGGHVCRHHPGGSVGGKGRNACQHLVGHHTERVDVGAVIDVAPAGGLFRREIRGRPDDRGCRGDCLIARGARFKGARDAEVGQEHVAARQQHVVRLDVSMDDALGVRVGERVGQLAQDRRRVGQRQLPLAPQSRPQRLAVDVRHHVEERVTGRAGIEERKDVRMLEVRRGPDLGDEPIGADTGDDLGLHDFQRDQAIVPEVVREIHAGHTTRTQDAVDPVMACEGFRQGRRERAHRWRAGYTFLRRRAGRTFFDRCSLSRPPAAGPPSAARRHDDTTTTT